MLFIRCCPGIHFVVLLYSLFIHSLHCFVVGILSLWPVDDWPFGDLFPIRWLILHSIRIRDRYSFVDWPIVIHIRYSPFITFDTLSVTGHYGILVFCYSPVHSFIVPHSPFYDSDFDPAILLPVPRYRCCCTTIVPILFHSFYILFWFYIWYILGILEIFFFFFSIHSLFCSFHYSVRVRFLLIPFDVYIHSHIHSLHLLMCWFTFCSFNSLHSWCISHYPALNFLPVPLTGDYRSYIPFDTYDHFWCSTDGYLPLFVPVIPVVVVVTYTQF